jgi:GNAT superfamily N-acetyltransferase
LKDQATLDAYIADGFLYDGWIAVGVYKDSTLIGCAISRSLGTLHIKENPVPNTGLVDFFCVHKAWRKKGIASLLLQELVRLTAKKDRLVHLFQKEGFPLSPIPPIWQSHYLWRKKGLPSSLSEHLGKEGIATRSLVKYFSYTNAIPHNSIASIPKQLTGDSELYSFNYKGYSMNLCITDTFHRSVPEGWKLGEIQWILPSDGIPIPLAIQEMAIETLADASKYEIILLDATLPHRKTKGWQKDSPYGYYLFNYNPGHFFSLKPYFVV